MTAFLSPVAGAGAQFFDNSGKPLAGGLLYTYLAGTVAAQATWTDSTQVTQNANPIVLNSVGRPSNEIWLKGGTVYKFVLTDSVGTVLGTWDNVSGINDANYSPFSEWVSYAGGVPTYVASNQFTLAGNVVGTFNIGRRIQYNLLSGTFYGTITASSYSSGTALTTVTFTPDSTGIDATCTGIAYGFMSGTNSSLPTTVYAPTVSPTFTGIPTAPTAAPGTNTLQLATTAFVIQQAFATALPAQASAGKALLVTNGTAASWTADQTGNGGKVLTTDGSNLSWSYAGIGVIGATVTDNYTITSATPTIWPCATTAIGKSITAPAVTTSTPKGLFAVLDNKNGGYPVGYRDSTGTLIAAVAPGGFMHVYLEDNSTAAGTWRVEGTNLEPGLITIDSTFSSTYSGTVLAPFVALDNNTSIHFAALSSGFAAFVVDNTGKVLTTPVTVSSTASSQPRTAFKISATQAIVFFGSSTTDHQAVVLTLSGTSPSLSLAVGTAAALTGTFGAAWDGENFTSAPKIAQLSSTLYVASNVNGTNTSAVAISVSGSTVNIGALANIITTSSVASSTTTYALTATTALVLYLSGAAAPYTINAVVISVSGTTCTVGAPLGTFTMANPSPPSIVLLSSTKVLIACDANAAQVTVFALVISGTTVTMPAGGLNVETGLATGLVTFTASSATRYNPHLWAIGANTAGLWYIDSNGVSRAVVLSESGGTVTAGTILYRSISGGASGSTDCGVILPQGTAEFLAIKQDSAASTTTGKFRAVAHKISGSTITSGSTSSLYDLPLFLGGANTLNSARLSSGDYVVYGSVNSGYSPVTALPVLRTNGDAINLRGGIKVPALDSTVAAPTSVSSNRLVLLGSSRMQGTTVGASTYQLRLLNVEIAA